MKRIALIAALLAAGCLAALSLGVGRASAWGPGNLPPGFVVVHSMVGNGTGACGESYQFTAPVVSNPLCTDSPTFQADFDAFVNANFTAPVTTTAPPSTTAQTSSPPVTTTVVVTTTTPADTTSVSTDPNAPTPQPVTNTLTVTTTAGVVEQSLQAQIDALAAQIVVLTDRVTRLEKASDAAWLAYAQAIQAGDDPATAALIARSVALNVIYGLGAFAP